MQNLGFRSFNKLDVKTKAKTLAKSTFNTSEKSEYMLCQKSQELKLEY